MTNFETSFSNDNVIDRLPLAITRDPYFEDAANDYLQSFVVFRKNPEYVSVIAPSSARQRILKDILHLHFSNFTRDPSMGATFEGLLVHQSRSRKNPAYGRAILRAVIQAGQRSGHLQVQQREEDRRIKIIYPTDTWISQEAERHEAALASLAFLQAHRSPFFAVQKGPELVERIAVTAAQTQDAVGVQLGEPDEPLAKIAACHGGLSTILAIADAWGRGRAAPSSRYLAASFRISGTQVRKILGLAAERGLIALEYGGKIRDATNLLLASRRLVAHEFSLYRRLALGQAVGAARSQRQ